ncbi:MAG TPA: lytic transglycosylase domain-containing protein [Thermoleophilia bacterium]|nr:lytic transglycosylase domain-containing protein [Thermoleophilia bacterium]HQG04386.1 lytic transglycosylase domain-containing protein [Thermoleophilia bacterium]HQG54103.1 lytic transglycosylase domain-containing protein [Thermoleophilia bacterium]HQJ98032.1 lytic transglycosylase domain-containing protein [Thermoleophilia bacterium]
MRRAILVAATVVAVAATLFALHRMPTDRYARWLPVPLARAVYPLEHDGLIREAARRNDVDPALVAAVIYAESGFREDAVSSRGAVGLMQLLPSTATEIARRTGGERFVVDDLRDAAVNIRYGTHYLAALLERYDGSLVEALAAYQAGARVVDRCVARGAGAVRIGDIPYADTRDYVHEVIGMTRIYRRAYAAELGGQE